LPDKSAASPKVKVKPPRLVSGILGLDDARLRRLPAAAAGDEVGSMIARGRRLLFLW